MSNWLKAQSRGSDCGFDQVEKCDLFPYHFLPFSFPNVLRKTRPDWSATVGANSSPLFSKKKREQKLLLKMELKWAEWWKEHVFLKKSDSTVRD